MKSNTEINNDIFSVTQEIDNRFPELVKYFGETPIKITNDNKSVISLANLVDYYNTLDLLFNDYNVYHRDQIQ